MAKKKMKFNGKFLMNAAQRGIGAAGGYVAGEFVEDKMPTNNKVKGLLLFATGAILSEFYSNQPLVSGLGAGLAAAGTRTALKDNLGFMAGTPAVGDTPDDYALPEDDVVDEILSGINDDDPTMAGIDDDDPTMAGASANNSISTIVTP